MESFEFEKDLNRTRNGQKLSMLIRLKKGQIGRYLIAVQLVLLQMQSTG